MLHEIFHIIAARVLFREKLGIVFLPTGFVGRWKNFQPEKWKQCIIFAFGPFGIFLVPHLAVIPLQWNDKVELVRVTLLSVHLI